MDIKDELLKAAFEQEPFIALVGQSACGKGTLSSLMVQEYRRLCPERPCMAFGTGDLFRQNTPHFSPWNKGQIQARQDAGYLQPWSTASALWLYCFLLNYAGGPAILDGSPRSIGEVGALVDFFCGYAQKQLIVFCLDVTDEEAERRMIVRDEKEGATRPDTGTPESRAIKLGYFHSLVEPGLAVLATIPQVTLIHVDAMQSKESVACEVLSRLQYYPNL